MWLQDCLPTPHPPHEIIIAVGELSESGEEREKGSVRILGGTPSPPHSAALKR